MKKISALLGIGLCISAALASDAKEEKAPFLQEIDNIIVNIDDYRKEPDGTPRYFPIRGFMCQAIWECDGLLTCKAGNTGLETEDGKLYFSPLLWAMLDYLQCTDERRTPGKLEDPCIQGNTPQQARELVIRLIRENKNNCVNDSLCDITPLQLATWDDELILLLLEKGADPNKMKLWQGMTLLCLSADRGSVETVKFLLDHGADPTYEANPKLKEILSDLRIKSQENFNKLKCLALIAEAQTRWEKK